MNVTLDPMLRERIEEKVRSGEFDSADALVEQAVAFFLDYEGAEMDEDEFREAKTAIEEALEQAERGDGVALADFDHTMRAKYGIQR